MLNPSSNQKLSRTKILIFSILPLLTLLLVGEVGLRVYSYYFRTAYERFNYSTGRLELVPNTHVVMPDGREILINSKGFVGPEFEAIKRPNVYRIFALGDSCTFGGSWNESYPALLERLLNSGLHGQRFEVINAGVEGYNSEYALNRLREEILKYQPDMVVIYIGWNDLMKNDPANVAAVGKYGWLAKAMNESYLIKAYSKLFFFHLRPLIAKPGLMNQEEMHEFDAFTPRTFQENVEAMVDLLLKHNIAVVLMTRPTAVRPEMTSEQIEKEHIFFPYFPGAYSVSRLLSLHDAYNKAVRTISASRHVPLVDLDNIVNQQDKAPLFWDTMHPSQRGHAFIAAKLADHLHKDLTIPGAVGALP